jgi:hypothetical protein
VHRFLGWLWNVSFFSGIYSCTPAVARTFSEATRVVGGPSRAEEQDLVESVKIELADDGKPAPAALPDDCCGLPSLGPTNGRNLANLE